MNRKYKRDSEVIDKLMFQAEKLHSEGMSVNKACEKVGLQTTVYYFRKRKEQALEKLHDDGHDLSLALSDKDIASLKKEYRELEARMNAIKMLIAEKIMNSTKF